MEEYNNKVQVISLDEDSAEFSAKSTFDHPYPTTKIMWIPDGVCSHCLRLMIVVNILNGSCFRRKEYSQTYWQRVGTI